MHISNSPENPAVRVTNGCKSYGKNIVLQQLDMTVPVGTTYALLGSSGCGKTTLLSCLIGLQKLSAGSVQIFGQDTSQTDRNLVGYMPQETGLHSELRISEELHYFGRLYGLEWEVVEERINFFVDLLQLPKKDPVIQNLSGGETRRVSLAVALLHKAKLLILDEATVGVDPLLRQSIWEHLYEIVKNEGTTIILSTHYTEEARQADVVSVMRNGKLLVEENPQSLMVRYNSEILEDIVVKLCRSQEFEISDNPAGSDNGFANIIRQRSSGFKSKNENIADISYKRKESSEDKLSGIVVAGDEINPVPPQDSQLTGRNTGDKLSNVTIVTQNGNGHCSSPAEYQLVRRNSRDKLNTVVTESTQESGSTSHQQESHKGKSDAKSKTFKNWCTRQLQTINAIFILNILTFVRHPVILYIMLIVPANNLAIVYYLFKPLPNTNLGVVNIEQPNCFQLPMDQYKLGCELSVFYHESHKLTLEEFPSEESALAAAQRGRNYGYIVVPGNFSRNMQNRVAFGRFADRETLDGSSISVHLDYSHHIRNGFLLEGLFSGLEGFVEKKLNDSAAINAETGMSINYASSTAKPFKINEKMKELNAVEPSWSDIGSAPEIAWFMAIIPTVVSVTLVWDKKRGVFQRTIVGGGRLPHLFIAAMGTYFLAFLIQMTLTIAVVFYLNMPFLGSILDILIVTYGQTLVGLSYGFLLGMVFNQEIEVIFCIMALSITSSISNGGITSLDAVEGDWVKWMIVSLPSKVPTISLENIMFRGWGFSQPGVWHCLIVQGGWIFGCLALTTVSFYTTHV